MMLIKGNIEDVDSHIEVTFNVASLALEGFEEHMVSKISRKKLHEEYRSDLWYKKSKFKKMLNCKINVQKNSY